jgi:RimJ/RimL family protein N-acetyltransferase
MSISCEEVFQALKGVVRPSMCNFSIPIPGICYGLFPVPCIESRLSDSLLTMLTKGRNANRRSFLTFFNATNDRTKCWLTQKIAHDPSRILFSIKSYENEDLYGYLGFSNNSVNHNHIEADAVVRFSNQKIQGLMIRSLIRLTGWAIEDLGKAEVRVRVLSDNPAINFYQKCGFYKVGEIPLFEDYDETGALVALSEEDGCGKRKPSLRTLTYMVMKPA